ncbi:hypothetical protein Nepgr_005257 [Nepenthes gracilis]|uniref:Uncharacterized protein n=1 Tax=Nepenthes gracilis TaxID=150966 RepID=A0AAD3XG79_NEPGR|nr:hypothetical protein Nepgr_005257 [Nepenthes gracilis]
MSNRRQPGPSHLRSISYLEQGKIRTAEENDPKQNSGTRLDQNFHSSLPATVIHHTARASRAVERPRATLVVHHMQLPYIASASNNSIITQQYQARSQLEFIYLVPNSSNTVQNRESRPPEGRSTSISVPGLCTLKDGVDCVFRGWSGFLRPEDGVAF